LAKGVVLYRGFSVQEACHQIFGNAMGADKGFKFSKIFLSKIKNIFNFIHFKKKNKKGRQMPIVI
jgi:TPP-dependent pyruvate/acetoin dehydrogenase alpha subunit